MTGASASADRAGGPTDLSRDASQPEALIPSASDPHPYYGGCDGFGPLWMCSECTGLIGLDGGTFKDTHTGAIVSPDDAAGRVGDFLMSLIESAAVAGWGCSDTPQSLEGFMRRSLWMALPGNPWRNEDRAAQAMSAGTAKTEGLGGDSPASAVRQDAPETPLSTPLPSGSIER